MYNTPFVWFLEKSRLTFANGLEAISSISSFLLLRSRYLYQMSIRSSITTLEQYLLYHSTRSLISQSNPATTRSIIKHLKLRFNFSLQAITHAANITKNRIQLTWANEIHFNVYNCTIYHI